MLIEKFNSGSDNLNFQNFPNVNNISETDLSKGVVNCFFIKKTKGLCEELIIKLIEE